MNYTFQLKRLEPTIYKGQSIAGYLETLDDGLIYQNGAAKPDWCKDVCDYVHAKYGGGKYQVVIFDEKGCAVKTKTGDLWGEPKLYTSPFTGRVS